jgi:hypothetical protein
LIALIGHSVAQQRPDFPLSGLNSFTLITLIEAPNCGSCRYAISALPSLPGEVLAVVQKKASFLGLRCRVVHSLGLATTSPLHTGPTLSRSLSRFDKPFRRAQGPGPEPAEGLKALSSPKGSFVAIPPPRPVPALKMRFHITLIALIHLDQAGPVAAIRSPSLTG